MGPFSRNSPNILEDPGPPFIHKIKFGFVKVVFLKSQ